MNDAIASANVPADGLRGLWNRGAGPVSLDHAIGVK
jgi:hypothetical protein